MSMFLFLDSNYRNALEYGGRQIGSIFSEAVQLNSRRCSDRASMISQISYCMRPLPSDRRVALVFGGFENFATGSRSIVQSEPLIELKFELTAYVKMIQDMLQLYPQAHVYVLPPIFRAQPTWFSSSYASLLPLFLSEVSHIDATRVLVVPPLIVTGRDLDIDGVHLLPASLQRVLDLLLKTFRDGVFVRPDDYPVVAAVGEFCLFLFLFMCLSFYLFTCLN